MKYLILVALVLLHTGSATAKSTKTQKKAAQRQTEPKLGTSFRFDGSSLHGKFQTSASTTATVEDDKFLEDMLGARKSFADRTAKDRDRN